MPSVKIKEKGIPLSHLPLPQPVIERNIIVVVARRRIEDNVPELFFYNGNTRGERWLMCYAHVGQHSDCDIDYYRRHTKMASIEEPDVLALLNEWANQPPIQPFELHTTFAPFGRKIA